MNDDRGRGQKIEGFEGSESRGSTADVEANGTGSHGSAPGAVPRGGTEGVGIGSDLGSGTSGIAGGSGEGTDLGSMRNTQTARGTGRGDETASREPSMSSNWERAPELAATPGTPDMGGGGSAGGDDAPGTAGGGGTYFGPGTQGMGGSNASSGATTGTSGVGSHSDVGGATTGPGGGTSATE